MKQKLMKIIQHYGLKHQLRQLNQEVFELIEAEYEMYYTLNANNYERLINHILEEYADVQVMLEQHRLYWELSLKKAKKIFKFKVNRQLERMKNEGND